MKTIPIKISRDGKEIGAYDLPVVIELFGAKKLLPTDHYWRTGMTDWQPLPTLIAQAEAELQKKQFEAEQRDIAAQAERDAEAEKKYAQQVMRGNQEGKISPNYGDGLMLLLAAPFLIYGGFSIVQNFGGRGYDAGAMTNALLFFGIGVLLAKK